MNTFFVLISVIASVGGVLLAFLAKGIGRYLYKKKIIHLIYKGARVIDVRDIEEYEKQHYPTALHMTYQNLVYYFQKHQPTQNDPVLIYSDQALRARQMIRRLHALGYRNIYAISINLLPL